MIFSRLWNLEASMKAAATCPLRGPVSPPRWHCHTAPQEGDSEGSVGRDGRERPSAVGSLVSKSFNPTGHGGPPVSWSPDKGLDCSIFIFVIKFQHTEFGEDTFKQQQFVNVKENSICNTNDGEIRRNTRESEPCSSLPGL